jgi:hypothetical protein
MSKHEDKQKRGSVSIDDKRIQAPIDFDIEWCKENEKTIETIPYNA